MKGPLPSLSELSSQILEEVSADSRAKEAAVSGKVAAVPCNTELGALLYKLAAELRASPKDVTYEDLAKFLGRSGR